MEKLALVLFALLAGCAHAPASGVVFGVLGDTPYNAAEVHRLDALIDDMNRERLTVFRNTTFPFSSTPCTLKTSFARSIPTVVILLMTSPPERLCLETQSLHPVPSQAGEVPFIR